MVTKYCTAQETDLECKLLDTDCSMGSLVLNQHADGVPSNIKNLAENPVLESSKIFTDVIVGENIQAS